MVVARDSALMEPEQVDYGCKGNYISIYRPGRPPFGLAPFYPNKTFFFRSSCSRAILTILDDVVRIFFGFRSRRRTNRAADSLLLPISKRSDLSMDQAPAELMLHGGQIYTLACCGGVPH